MKYSLNCGSETDPFTIWHFWDFSRFEFHVSCKCSCTGRAWCRSENPFNFQKIVKLQKLLHDESHIAVSKYDFLLFGQKVVLHLEFKPTSPQLNDWSSSSEPSLPSSWPLVIVTIQMNQPRVCWVTSWVTYPGSNRSRFMRGGPKQVKYFPNFFSSVILSPSITAICTGQEPLYERRADLLNKMPFGSRLGAGGEIRQVMGTPPVGRHRLVLNDNIATIRN